MRPIPGSVPCLPCMRTLYHGGYECTTSITGTCRRCLSDCSAIPQPLHEEAACLSLFAWVCLEKNKYPANYPSLRLAVDDFCARVEEWQSRHPLSSCASVLETDTAVDLLAADELASFFVERRESSAVKKKEKAKRIMVHEDKNGQRLSNSAVVRHSSSIRPAIAPTVELSLRNEKRGRQAFEDENSLPLVKLRDDDATFVDAKQNGIPVCKKRCFALDYHACIESVNGIDTAITPCRESKCIIQRPYGKLYVQAPVCGVCDEVLESDGPSCSECVGRDVHHECACDGPPDKCGTCASGDVNEDWSCNQCIADVVGHCREERSVRSVRSMADQMDSEIASVV